MDGYYFACDQCGHVDHSHYAYPAEKPGPQEAKLCTQCQTGHWHGHFPYKPYDPEYDMVANRGNGIGLG